MSYNLKYKNQSVDAVGKAPINVQVGTTDNSSTSLVLTGKGAANYGTLQQENLLHLLENFADTVEPLNPTVGQMWYDVNVSNIKVLVDKFPKIWKNVGGIQVTDVGQPPPALAATGDLWFERTGSTSGFLYVYSKIGRYPSTATTIGGWDQIWPEVSVVAGREEYDLVRELVDRICGTSVSAFGSGAIGKSIKNLTNFTALDTDLRNKFKALPLDPNILYSTNADTDITRQAENSTLFYFNDSSSPSDGFIGGFDSVGPNPGSIGYIIIDGSVIAAPSSLVSHSQATSEAFIIWDRTSTLTSTAAGSNVYFVAQYSIGGQWQYDNNSNWVNFTPVANQYVIGTINSGLESNSYPNDKAAFIWGTAVPIVGVKYEHLKVEPNSQDWDVLLAAAKYAVNRLEVPVNFVKSISSMPFVSDGRQISGSLTSLSTTDVRYPSAARRSNRKSSIITQVQNFSETINTLNTSIFSHFSIRGINGQTGSNPTFASTVLTVQHAALPSTIASNGSGSFRTKFRFLNMDEMNAFLGSGGALQFEMTHSGGSLAGDANFRAGLSAVGTWRLTADKTRIFGQALPLTISKSVINAGIWNGSVSGVQVGTITFGGASISAIVYRVSNTEFDVMMSFVVGSTLSGTTSLVVKTIGDYEKYTLNGIEKDVYPKPLAYTSTDAVIG